MSNITRQWASRLLRAVNEHRHARVVIPWSDNASASPTLYFHTPDQNEPSGGVLMMYRHVDLLNSAGIPAFVLHQRRGFRCTWFDNQTPVTDVASARVGPRDVLIVSEPDVVQLCGLTASVRHIILNQSGHLTWKRAPERVSQHYATSSHLAGVITVSEHAAALLRYAFGSVDVRHVHPGIDAALFHPDTSLRLREIVYMPRRGCEDAQLVLQLLRCRGVLDGWQVTPLDGLRHSEVAARLRRSRIFLNLPYLEGFGLPAAEAMACGNYVIGYHGFGGKEFFRTPASCPVETGDVLGVARAVEDVISRDAIDPSWCHERGLEASRFILQTYSKERERDDVLRAYAQLSGIPAADPQACLVPHGVH